MFVCLFHILNPYVVYLYKAYLQTIINQRDRMIRASPYVLSVLDLPFGYKINLLEMMSAAVSFVILLAFWFSSDYYTVHLMINNFIATLICLWILQTTHIGSFKTGFINLILLFCYDVYFVYYSTIMVEVA
mmetsp:Transcript_17603/g.12632  ORF Transcript_17603/g.12632 Transcript_17603/m.12632 type:complete len:131 (-) Transcript_17603:566-958(-)